MTQASHTKNVVPGSTAAFLEDLQTFLREEDAERFVDMFNGFIVAGGTHTTGAGLTKTPDVLTAYVSGRLVSETGSIVYPDNDTGWVIAHRDITGNIGTFTRVTGTHYLIDFASSSKPALPADSIWLMEVTTAGGSVTVVTDLRARVPHMDVVDNEAALPAAGRRGRLAYTRAENRVWADTGPAWVGFIGDAEIVAARDGEMSLSARLDDFEVLVKLTNRTGASVAANDVVALSTLDDASVVLDNTQGSIRPHFVAHETIANTALGRFRGVGKATVKVNGVVARGQYLRKSATTLALEDTGVAVGASIPQGAVAVSLTAAAGPGLGTVVAWLFGLAKDNPPDFPTGTRLVFDQDTPPAGWTRDTTVDDRVIRIQGVGARVHGGAWAVSGLTMASHTHTVGRNSWGRGTGNSDLGLLRVAPDSGGALVDVAANDRVSGGPSTSGVSSDGSWRPLHRSMILASKD